MANLSSNIRVISSYASTGTSTGGAGFGTTGDPVALSTAAALGSTTVSPGGFPFATTGFSMSGYEGVLGIAHYYSGTTGGGAGTSGIATLQYYVGNATSTALSTTFVPLQGAYVTGYSTTPATLVLDVIRPKSTQAVGQFQLQVASSSQIAFAIIAIPYGPKITPTTNSTALNTAGVGSYVVASALSVSPGT